jgi:hypothetical protein
LAIDDTPTARYGPHVVGAGVHRDPTPGPSGNKHLYGHIWVMLSWVVRHPTWGPIGLPIRSLMYIRRLTFQTPAMRLEKPWSFRTKLELAAELVEWAAWWFSWLKKRLLVVADGAYAKRPFLDRMRAINAVVVSRLRKDAALFDLPPQKKPGQRGRPRKYGVNRLNLAGKAAHRHGWLTGVFQLYGRSIEKTYKTFLATYPPARGVIRVVLVKEDDGWIPFFATDPTLTVQEILEAVADAVFCQKCGARLDASPERSGTPSSQAAHAARSAAASSRRASAPRSRPCLSSACRKSRPASRLVMRC